MRLVTSESAEKTHGLQSEGIEACKLRGARRVQVERLAAAVGFAHILREADRLLNDLCRIDRAVVEPAND